MLWFKKHVLTIRSFKMLKDDFSSRFIFMQGQANGLRYRAGTGGGTPSTGKMLRRRKRLGIAPDSPASGARFVSWSLQYWIKLINENFFFWYFLKNRFISPIALSLLASASSTCIPRELDLMLKATAVISVSHLVVFSAILIAVCKSSISILSCDSFFQPSMCSISNGLQRSRHTTFGCFNILGCNLFVFFTLWFPDLF